MEFFNNLLYDKFLFCKNNLISKLPDRVLATYVRFKMHNEISESNFLRKHQDIMTSRLRQKIVNSIAPHKKIIYIISGLGALIIIYNIIRKIFFPDKTEWIEVKEQGSEGVRPQPNQEEKENVWYNNEFILNPIDLGTSSTCFLQMDRETLIKKIGSNCISYSLLKDNGKYGRARATAITSDIFLFNTHMLPQGRTFDIKILLRPEGVSLHNNLVIRVSQSDIRRVPNTDISIVQLKGLPPFRSLLNLIPEVSIKPRIDGFYLRRGFDGVLETMVVRRLLHKTVSTTITHAPECDIWEGVTKIPGKDGDCGSLLIGESPQGPILLGFHFLGNPNFEIVQSTALTRELINPLLRSFGVLIESNAVKLSVPSKVVELLDLHKKSEARYIDEGNAEVYGSLSLARASGKSRVSITPMSCILSEQGYEIKYTKPDLRSWRPWHLALKELVNPASKFDNDILNLCVGAFTNDIISGINSDIFKREILIYDDFTAINGAAGVTFIDKMNRNTSLGFPYQKSKRTQLFPIAAEGLNLDPMMFTEEIMTEVRNIENTYRSGKRYNPIFSASLKDEPVTFEKAQLGKTRVFSAAPTAWCIVVRKYLLSTVRLIQFHQKIFECACGITAQGKEWQSLYEHLIFFGKDRMVAGDFKKFDKRMCGKIILSAFEILENICKRSTNYEPEDMLVIKGIALDTAYNWQNFNGTLMQFMGGNPSGQPLTVIINSLVNCLYMRYCYVVITGLHPNTFKNNVHLMTYGDDNVLNVSSTLNEFNHTRIQEELKKLDIDYTMADKISESVPFIHIDSVSFLKRTFRYDSNLGYIVAPLELESIEKMLMVWNRSKTISQNEQMVAIISSANMEYFFHGKQLFEEKQIMFKNLINRLGLSIYCNDQTLASYETLSTRFLNTKPYRQMSN